MSFKTIEINCIHAQEMSVEDDGVSKQKDFFFPPLCYFCRYSDIKMKRSSVCNEVVQEQLMSFSLVGRNVALDATDDQELWTSSSCPGPAGEGWNNESAAPPEYDGSELEVIRKRKPAPHPERKADRAVVHSRLTAPRRSFATSEEGSERPETKPRKKEVPLDDNGHPLGHRLFQNHIRSDRVRSEQRERRLHEAQQSELHECTFKPALSSRAQQERRDHKETIAMLADQDVVRRERMYADLSRIVEQERMKECHFRPAITKASVRMVRDREGSPSSRLFREGERRQNRQKLRAASADRWQRENAIGGAPFSKERIQATTQRLQDWEKRRTKYLDMLRDAIDHRPQSDANPDEVTKRLTSPNRRAFTVCDLESFHPTVSGHSAELAAKHRWKRYEELFVRYDPHHLGQVTKSCIQEMLIQLPSSDGAIISALRHYEPDAPVSFEEFCEALMQYELTYGTQGWGAKITLPESLPERKPRISQFTNELAKKRRRKGSIHDHLFAKSTQKKVPIKDEPPVSHKTFRRLSSDEDVVELIDRLAPRAASPKQVKSASPPCSPVCKPSPNRSKVPKQAAAGSPPKGGQQRSPPRSIAATLFSATGHNGDSLASLRTLAKELMSRQFNQRR